MYCTFYVLEINGNCDNCYSHKYKYGENFTVLKRNNKFLKIFWYKYDNCSAISNNYNN